MPRTDLTDTQARCRLNLPTPDSEDPIQGGSQDVSSRAVTERGVSAGRASGERRLLVVAYYFPPMGLSGVVRITKFLTHLRSLGWQVTVLTVDEVGYYAHDDALFREIEESGIEVVRTKTLDPLSIVGKRRREIRRPGDRTGRLLRTMTHAILQPDNKIGWKKHAIAAGTALLEKDHYDAILATAPPFTCFLIARELSQISGVPFVVDYRDPWIDNKNFPWVTPFHRRYAAGLEKEVLRNAESVVVVNRTIKESLLARWRFLTHESVHILPSGYDPKEIASARPAPLRSSRMRLLFSGVIPPGLTLRPFFPALAKLIEQRPALRSEIEAVFLGKFRETVASP